MLWDLRMVTIGEARFNPLSYDTGSVWPHDTAICRAGIDQYAQPEAAGRALARLFEASVHFDKSVPELFCGFARIAGEGPVGYPVAYVPQAWAGASAYMLPKAMLSSKTDACAREIRVVCRSLPVGADHVVNRDIDVDGVKICVEPHRIEDRVICAVTRSSCVSTPTVVPLPERTARVHVGTTCALVGYPKADLFEESRVEVDRGLGPSIRHASLTKRVTMQA